MDNETKIILQKSVNDWCNNNTDLIQRLESLDKNPDALNTLYNELNQLGLLSIFIDPETRQEISMLAEVAYQFAVHSAGIALIVVQQNLACSLLAQAKLDVPTGWVALPLYDSAVEWSYQKIRCQQEGTALCFNGNWSSISLLPIANTLLLPVTIDKDNTLSFLNINLTTADNDSVEVSPAFTTLGLRGVPSSDLCFNEYSVSTDNLILNSKEDSDYAANLWSQAEIYIMAIRSGIAESSYTAANDYAEERKQGGKIIIEHSLIRKMLADMYKEKSALEENWRAFSHTIRTDSGISDGLMGIAMNSAERLPWLTSDGIQILGGVGYTEDYIQERRYRDAKQCEFLLGHPQAKAFTTWQGNAS